MELTRIRLCAGAALALLLATLAAPAAAAPEATSSGRRVLVRAHDGALPAVLAAATRGGAVVERSFPALDTAVLRVRPAAMRALVRDPAVAAVTPDSSLVPRSASYDAGADGYSLYHVTRLIGARDAWRAATGAGVDVAIVDSGVAPAPGLAQAGKVVHGPDLSFESQHRSLRYWDTYGHGTHLAGIVAGRDPVADPARHVSDPAPFLGVAPGARIVSLKVADARGMADVSQVVAAISWVVEHGRSNGLNVRVLLLAYGTDSAQDYRIDPIVHAAEVAWRSGIVVVAAAGNSGAASGRLTSPATSPRLLAVGASDTQGTIRLGDDVIPPFSSHGDGVRNPDLVAPGAHLQSIRVRGSYIDRTSAHSGAINERFFRGSGTSQSAAVVAGAVALLLEARPDLTPDEVHEVLTSTTKSLRQADARGQGAGMVHVQGALNRTASRRYLPVPSTGTGSLDRSRGSARLVASDGTVLRGELDVFEQAWDASAMARALGARESWSSGVWNGRQWAGRNWAGDRWSWAVWPGCRWSGAADTGGTWSGSSWAGSTWAGSTWAGSTWAGSTWAGSTWAGSTWATGSWS